MNFSPFVPASGSSRCSRKKNYFFLFLILTPHHLVFLRVNLFHRCSDGERKWMTQKDGSWQTPRIAAEVCAWLRMVWWLFKLPVMLVDVSRFICRLMLVSSLFHLVRPEKQDLGCRTSRWLSFPCVEYFKVFLRLHIAGISSHLRQIFHPLDSGSSRPSCP